MPPMGMSAAFGDETFVENPQSRIRGRNTSTTEDVSRSRGRKSVENLQSRIWTRNTSTSEDLSWSWERKVWRNSLRCLVHSGTKCLGNIYRAKCEPETSAALLKMSPAIGGETSAEFLQRIIQTINTCNTKWRCLLQSETKYLRKISTLGHGL